MLKLFWKSLLVSPAILGTVLAVASNASASELGTSADTNVADSLNKLQVPTSFEVAQSKSDVLDQMEQYGNEGQTNTQGQVTSVNQLRDVEPTAWAYEALQSLVERYGCIVGYPDRTFRGDRALTRWEFAAGLNACLNVMERLIQENVAVLKEDIDKLKRLMQEFEAELAALGARVDNLEARTSFLEDHQFSTTTKLAGEVIFAVTDTFGNQGGQTQTVFQDRVRLNFNTSFTGKDRLVTRLSAGSGVPFGGNYNVNSVDKDGNPVSANYSNLQSPTLIQTFNLSPSTDNSVSVDWLAYYTPIELGKDFVLNSYVAAWGGIWSDFVPTINPYFEDYDGGNGALSAFASENPIYRIGGGSGIGFSLQLGFLQSLLGPTSFSFGYLSPTANNPLPQSNNPGQGDQGGLFNADYAALAQLNFNIGNAANLGFTYVNSYHGPDSAIFGAGRGLNNQIGVTGTSLANLSRSQLQNNGSLDSLEPLQDNVGLFNFRQKVANSLGAEFAWKISDGFSFSAFGTYSAVRLIGVGDGEIWSYGGGFAFPDFGGEGNLLGLFAGVQPYIGKLDFGDTGIFRTMNNPVHVELFYKYQVTDNISLTPGVIWISNPEQFNNNGSEVIGTLRGTFTF